MTRPDPLHSMFCTCQRCLHPGPGPRIRCIDRVILAFAAGGALLTLFLLFALKGS